MNIHKGEKANTVFKSNSGRRSRVNSWLQTLKPGDVMEIEAHEWKAKHPPYYIAYYLGRKNGWKFSCGHMKTGGWVIRRIA